MALWVQAQVASVESAASRVTLGRGGLGAAQHGAYPRQQGARTEGLGEVIVGAEVQAAHFVFLSAAHREEHYGCAGLGADVAQHVEAAGAGQVNVEDHQVGLLALEYGDGLRAVASLQSQVTFLPQGEESYVGGFDVYVVVANKEGDMSDVARKSHQITIPKGDFDKTKGKYYTYTLDLLMERGLYKVSVGVIDSISNVSGFAKDQIIAQDLR